MNVLYVASDQVVPGTTGGSVHVLEVARGLARRGHQVDVVVRRQGGADGPDDDSGVRWHRITWWPPHRFFRFRARAAVAAVAAETRPDVVMERYYNFGGEGIATAKARGVPGLLEVNSPVVDHPGSLKAALDAAMLVRPLKRYREAMVRDATALVAPIPEIVPASARARTERVTWGANVEAFSPQRRDPAVRKGLGVPEGAVAVLFSGSFRPWHGVHVLEDAARRLRHRDDIFFVLAGGGGTGAGDGYRGRRLGAVPYESMPAVVAACDVGVAPYDTARLPQLRLGFFWSPLKVFEYMASGLPTVTVRRHPLDEVVRDGEEGLVVAEADPAALAAALERLAGDAALRARLGANARERVVERYSWDSHCAQLEALMSRLVGEGRR
ncbi:MAG TPA: glycosyltransferase [Longimicrobiales bacterium]|nr:glycosyltransferase [Longimicrobiales bacterium]